VAYFLALAEAPAPHLGSIEWLAWRPRLDAEYDNLRAAVAWSHSAADGGEHELRLVGALADYSFHIGMLNELRFWIEQAHARRDTVSKLAQAKLLSATSQLAFYESDNARSLAFLEQALPLWQQIGDRSRIAQSYLALGILSRNLGDLDRSLVAAEQALRLFREIDDPWGIAAALLARGDIAFDRADYTGATTLFQEGLALAQQAGNLWIVGDAFLCLARVARAQGDYSQAVALYQQSLAQYAETDAFNRFIAVELGKAWIDQGDYAQATAVFRRLIAEDSEVRWTIPVSLESLAAIAAAQGADQRAARLWGSAEAARESIGVVMDVLEVQDYERWVSDARAQFDSTSFAAAWAAGRALTLEQAIAEALEPQKS
jgi:tetratricopeptide (TPR) repeat protein